MKKDVKVTYKLIVDHPICKMEGAKCKLQPRKTHAHRGANNTSEYGSLSGTVEVHKSHAEASILVALYCLLNFGLLTFPGILLWVCH